MIASGLTRPGAETSSVDGASAASAFRAAITERIADFARVVDDEVRTFSEVLLAQHLTTSSDAVSQSFARNDLGRDLARQQECLRTWKLSERLHATAASRPQPLTSVPELHPSAHATIPTYPKETMPEQPRIAESQADGLNSALADEGCPDTPSTCKPICTFAPQLADVIEDLGNAANGIDPKPRVNHRHGASMEVLLGDEPEDKEAKSTVSRGSSRVTDFIKALGGSSPQIPDMLTGDSFLTRGTATTIRKNMMQEPTDEMHRFRMNYPVRGEIRQCVMHPIFSFFFGVCILASVVLIGAEAEYLARTHDEDQALFLSLQGFLCVLFVVEVVLRILAFGQVFFGFGRSAHAREWRWNLFDSACVAMMLVDISLESWQRAWKIQGENTPIASALYRLVGPFRMMRVVRALRYVATVRVGTLRKMLYALQFSMPTLAYTMVLLLFVMYFFAVAFTKATNELRLSSRAEEMPQTLRNLVKFYGTVPRAMSSLYQSIAGGHDWHELMEPLEQLHWINAILFMLYTSITLFGVMNVATSVFVESALASVQHYKDLLIEDSLATKQVYVDHLRRVFTEIDYDNSGEISIDEMETFLADDHLQKYLESMDICPDEARTLFRLLDLDGSGQISFKEFCTGCMRIKGEAKSFDIQCMIYEHNRQIRKWQEFMDFVGAELTAIRKGDVLIQSRASPSVPVLSASVSAGAPNSATISPSSSFAQH